MRSALRLLSACGTAALVLLLSGCGNTDGRFVVKGKLLEGGQPFVIDLNKIKLPSGATGVPPGSRPLEVTFVAEDGTQYQAAVNPDTGTFEVPGTDRKGIKPGRYKVAITCSLGAGDYFNGKFAADKTKIARDVRENEEITIDVSKDSG